MNDDLFPNKIPNWISGKESFSESSQFVDKVSPVTGYVISRLTRSNSVDINKAVEAASEAQSKWAETPPVQRGMILHRMVRIMQDRQEQIARIVAMETGKSYKEAFGETGGAIALGLFYASEGQRLYGKTTTSGSPDRYAMTVRQPVGLAGVIIPANTPVANVAWKIFPALICGNGVILKASEDSPATAWIFGEIANEAGLEPGILNIMQGLGDEAGAPLVAHSDVGVISFTGSTSVGKKVQQVAGERLAKVSLELGGKNPLVVCDDADLSSAVNWVLLSTFSNAGQRCASSSRIIVFESIYNEFKQMLIEATGKVKVGNSDDDDLGPVINAVQLKNMEEAVAIAESRGARVLIGGQRLKGDQYSNGFYMAPTLIENASPDDDISTKELFGPIACLYKVQDFSDALAMANRSPYGLTASIHTRNIDRGIEFVQKVQTGVASINAGTYGSEPHMPFGGVKLSGNGTREPGTEALDVYSELKDIYINVDPDRL